MRDVIFLVSISTDVMDRLVNFLMFVVHCECCYVYYNYDANQTFQTLSIELTHMGKQYSHNWKHISGSNWIWNAAREMFTLPTKFVTIFAGKWHFPYY